MLELLNKGRYYGAIKILNVFKNNQNLLSFLLSISLNSIFLSLKDAVETPIYAPRVMDIGKTFLICRALSFDILTNDFKSRSYEICISFFNFSDFK